MKVLNIHSRQLKISSDELSEMFSSLASKNDRIWPHEKWPAMKFKDGLKIGAKGGHGPVRYQLIRKEIPKVIEFQFLGPKGLHGIHKFESFEREGDQIEIRHTIDMVTKGIGTLAWLVGIKWLHDALAEDALDKVENQILGTNKTSKWNLWVILLRGIVA